MNIYIYIITIFNLLFSYELYPDFASIVIDEIIIEKPFIGGFNRPKIQWLDWDYDNDEDLFLLDEDGKIKYFSNDGCSNNNCNFNLMTTSFYDIENISWFYIGDFDNDNDYDLVTQNPLNLHSMLYYQNINGNFESMETLVTINGDNVESDPVMTPTFSDIDNDGDFDFFTGNVVGTITFYENVGFTDDRPIFNFITNFWEDIYIVGSSFDQRHGASSISFIDLDNDADLDLAWGDYFQQSIYVVWNTGNLIEPLMDIENITQQFPQNDPVFTAGLNMPTFTDVDSDGDKDLFITVLSGAYGYQLKNNFIFYEMEDEFVFKKSNFIESLDLLSDINPEYADIDYDGDLDLFIGTDFDPSSFPWYGKIVFFENVGLDDNQEPIWTMSIDSIIDIESNNLSPVFVDIDFDEDLDIFVGDFNGELYLYRNIGNKYDPDFIFVEKINGIDLSGYSTPEFVDIDDDEDLDLLIGHMNGTIYFYENIGTKYDYEFQYVTSDYYGIDVEFRSNPETFDYDNDNDLDLFIGSGINNIILYENIGNSINPNFIIDNEIQFPHTGNNTSPVMFSSNQINGITIGVSTGGFLFIPLENNVNGDINNDSIINIFDIVLLIEYILYDFNENVSSYYMDINNDSFIDVLDVINIISLVLNSRM